MCLCEFFISLFYACLKFSNFVDSIECPFSCLFSKIFSSKFVDNVILLKNRFHKKLPIFAAWDNLIHSISLRAPLCNNISMEKENWTYFHINTSFHICCGEKTSMKSASHFHIFFSGTMKCRNSVSMKEKNVTSTLLQKINVT